MSRILLGGGCFWCMDAVFRRLRGVEHVVSGYAGGHNEHPTYEEVCSGNTGHAEVISIEYDQQVISLEVILSVFFSMHDPTTINRQGADVGEQYRSVIFYTIPEQAKEAQNIIDDLEREHVFPRPIVTSIEPYTNFYPAETYHQDYYANNQSSGYCRAAIDPKIAKLRQKFASYIIDEEVFL